MSEWKEIRSDGDIDEIMETLCDFHDSCDISEAELSFYTNILPGTQSRLIVWTDYDSFDPSNAEDPLKEPAGTYILSNSLKWRIIE